MNKSTLRRIGVLALLFGGAFAASRFIDTSVLRDPQAMQALMSEAGAWGVLGFLLAFALGQLAQLPGLPFVLAATFAYGPVGGFAASYLAALLAVTTTFIVVRSAGGGLLEKSKSKIVRKALDHLEDKPLRTVALLRALFALSPPLNYALAVSPVRCKQHFAASSIGLVVPIASWVLLADVLVAWIA